MAARKKTPKPVNFALQGGGAHGAFTWGVLDKFLEDGRVQINAITGTSAGAMNAVVMADGACRDGEDGAREALETFWRNVSTAGNASVIKRSPLDVLFGQWSLDASPAYLAFDIMTRFASPYEFNPLDINPLRDLVGELVNFDNVRKCRSIDLFVAATNVHTGKIKVFEKDEITLDAVMASACLPHLYQAVEIDDTPYWDGGFMGNPPLYPLFYHTDVADTILVQINPVARYETPKTAREILNRMNEITFNSTLLRELRAVEFVSRLIDEGSLSQEQYSKVHIHRISSDKDLNPLSASSKFNAEWSFLQHLRDIGREAAQLWLDEHYDALGKRGTLDLKAEFS
ncbi:MAG: patatin-like phospholipase family protein [Stappiaceae bacterium]